jgi:GNAT superfamily N-acetyltransferase
MRPPATRSTGRPCRGANFLAYNLPALERNEARHNLILAILGGAPAGAGTELRRWLLGAPGQCAVQMPGRPVVLGELGAAQCRALAEQSSDLDYPAVVGPDETARHFADHATALGLEFLEPIPQQIHALSDPPRYPGAPGHARLIGGADGPLFTDWMIAFVREATPHDTAPDREQLAKVAGDGRYMFWTVDGEPVAMAGVVRRTRNAVAIAGVYTPPPLRGRGYAGSVTAAVAERAYAEGKATACLYTDLRNPFSNRCYAKIGFKPVCPSWHYPRALKPRHLHG